MTPDPKDPRDEALGQVRVIRGNVDISKSVRSGWLQMSSGEPPKVWINGGPIPTDDLVIFVSFQGEEVPVFIGSSAALSAEELRGIAERLEPGVQLDCFDRAWAVAIWHDCSRLLAAHDQLLARCEELEDDLLFMLQTRKVLYEGNRLTLLACGTYTDCQERGGDYPLHKAMEDVMTASRDARVQFDRLMNERVLAQPEPDTEEAQ